jgi:hypothetical protein
LDETSFYLASAEVIPVLFLGLLIDLRILERDSDAVGRAILLIAAFVTVVIGEVAALMALHAGSSDFTFWAVQIALALIAALFLFSLVGPQMRILGDALERRWPKFSEIREPVRFGLLALLALGTLLFILAHALWF